MKVMKHTLALKPRADLTESPKQGTIGFTNGLMSSKDKKKTNKNYICIHGNSMAKFIYYQILANTLISKLN